ncbi:MAG: flippase-like domain-containing protein [Polyangiaceae bacterium]|nr:flippase-like domain-containing protein [Polyangiaceae bacterium]
MSPSESVPASTGESEDAPNPGGFRGAKKPWWRTALPFGLAVVLLGWVLHRSGWQQLKGALGQTNFFVFFLFSWVMQMLSLVADSYATTYVYRKTVCPIRFREMLIIRGASYLPSMLNHNLGQAWLTYVISKRYSAPLWRVAGATLLVYGTNLAGLLLLCALALPFNGDQVPWLAPVVGVAALGGLAYFALLKWGARFLSRWQATAPLVEIGVRGHLKAIAVRIPHVGLLFLSTWLVFSFFGVWVPPGAALAYVPVLMMVAAMPLTPGAIGTRDAVALELLAGFATGEHGVSAIAATTLSWFVMLNLGAALVSPLLMRQATQLTEAPSSSK